MSYLPLPPFAATSAATSRTAQARAADRLNVLDNGLLPDGTTNNSPALTTLLARAAAMSVATGGGRVDVDFPSTGPGAYYFASTVAVPAGIALVGLGKPTILAGSQGAVFSLTGVGNVELRNLRIDGQNATYSTISPPILITGATGNVLLEDIELANPRGEIHIVSSSGVSVRRPIINGSLLHGVYLSGCSDCQVIDGLMQGNGGFGVILTAGCFRCWIQGNRTTQSAIELIGVTQDSYENHIIANHAEGTGDNGISVTGYKNVILGNVVKGCQGNGIELYGERNVCVSNTCLNNAQGNAGNTGWRGGIAVQPAFGGAGQWNVISSNVLDDDQASPTQLYGVWLGASGYVAWATGQAVTSGAYRYQAANLYKATSSGTTGATAPTVTSGSVSDGGVTWLFVRAFLTGTPGADYNEVSSNMVPRFGTARYLDASGGGHNEFIGGLVPVTLPSPIIASQISNTGGVASIAISGTYTYPNGNLPTITIAAPPSGGQQATGSVSQMFLFGFGSLASGGSGYAVNDIVSIVGGTPAGNPGRLKVLTVDGSGAVLTFTSTGAGGGFTYSAMPSAGNTTFSGGTGAGFTLTGTSWHINAITVTAAGSGYTSVPTVTAPSGSGTPTLTATLNSAMQINSGSGNILLDGTATKLGIAGASGAPVIGLGATIDGSGVRQTLGATYTVPANTSLVRFVQTGTVTTSTVTLPTAVSDGQAIQFVNYTGAITALTFSPAVGGWTNTSTLAVNTGLRVRWDATAAAWQREQ